MKMLKASLAVSVAFLASSVIDAAPQISGVDGSLSPGSKVTISGNSFTSANAVPMLFDEVSNTSSASLAEGSAVPTSGNLWTENGSPWANEIVKSSVSDYSASKSGDTPTYKGQGKAHMGWPEALSGVQARSLYVTWLLRPNEDLGKDGGPNKVIRVWDASSGEKTRISWNTVALGYAADGDWAPLDWATWGGSANRWNRLEIYVDADSNEIKTWTNGKLVHDVSDFTKSSTTSEGLNIGLIGFDPRDGGNFPNLEFDITDIYASRTLARVELSSAPTWSEAMDSREVQPVTSWSNNEIEFEVANTQMDLTGEVYVYVVDSNGDANETGYPFAGCARCPSAPPALEVE